MAGAALKMDALEVDTRIRAPAGRCGIAALKINAREVDAGGRTGLIVWIAAGFTAGCAAAGALSAARDDLARWLGHAAEDGCVLIAFAGATLILALLLLLRHACERACWRALWFVAALLAGAAHAQLERSRVDECDAQLHGGAQRELVSVDGWLTDDPIPSPARSVSFTLRTLDRPSRTLDVELLSTPIGLRAGDIIRVRGWLTPEPPPRNPGEFDAAEWRQRRGVAGRIVGGVACLLRRAEPSGADQGDCVPGAALSLPARVPPASVLRLRLVGSLRGVLRDRTTPPVRDMIVAMTLGAKGATMPQVRALFARSGLSHFIVISGFHLAVIAAAVLCVARRLGAGRRASGGLLVAVSVVFLLLLESHVSVFRAGLAGVMAGAALLCGRPWPALSILSLVTLLILAIDPRAVEMPAFQLSFGAVAALLVLAPRISLLLARGTDHAVLACSRIRGRSVIHVEGSRAAALARIAVRPLAAAVAAWVVTAPITIMHFGHAAVWAIPGSVLLAPLASFITIAGIVAAIVGSLAPSPAAAPATLLGLAGGLFLAAVEQISDLPGSRLRWPLQPGWWCAAMVTLPFLVVILRKGTGVSNGALRAAPAYAAIVIWALLGLRPLIPSAWSDLTVVALDLGRARSTLLCAGRGALLIDAGAVTSEHAGARTIARALLDLGITRVDALVLTERSFNAMGAAAPLLSLIRVDRVVMAPSFAGASPGTAPGRLKSEAARLGIPLEIQHPGLLPALWSTEAGPLLQAIETDGDRPGTRRLRIRLQLEAVPESLHRTIDCGVGDAASLMPVRGARRWRLDPVTGWRADRFHRRSWTPSPPDR